MPAVHLRSDATLGLLVADVVVLWLCLPIVVESEISVSLRVFFGAISLMALGLGLRSVRQILRGSRARRAARGAATGQA